MLMLALRSGFADRRMGELQMSELAAKVAAILVPIESSIVESVLQGDTLMGDLLTLDDSPGESTTVKVAVVMYVHVLKGQ